MIKIRSGDKMMIHRSPGKGRRRRFLPAAHAAQAVRGHFTEAFQDPDIP